MRRPVTSLILLNLVGVAVTLLATPALRITVSPAALFAGRPLTLTCRVTPDPMNRQLRYGLQDFTESRRDLEGADAPVTWQVTYPHTPCGTDAAFCQVIRADASHVEVFATLLVAGCN